MRESGIAIPPPAFDRADAKATGTAVLADGCFWGVQSVFEHARVRGFLRTDLFVSRVGLRAARIAGDDLRDAAETVQITYDPARRRVIAESERHWKKRSGHSGARLGERSCSSRLELRFMA